MLGVNDVYTIFNCVEVLVDMQFAMHFPYEHTYQPHYLMSDI